MAADRQSWAPGRGCLALTVPVPVIGLLILFLGSNSSAVEIARIPSPDGRLEAVLTETKAGAAASFGYRIEVVRMGAPGSRRTEIAYLYAATRSDCAHGVNLRSRSPERLVAEYREARHAATVPAEIDSRRIAVDMRPGIADPRARCGSMGHGGPAKGTG